MPRSSDKRERLIRSADELILRQGFKQTTLQDIAQDSGVPLGNVYYYFKTKEDIGKTIVQSRIQKMEELLADCSKQATPQERLLKFLEYPVKARLTLAQSGCPLGTLAYELSRSDNLLSAFSHKLIEVLLDWSTHQFQQMGRSDYQSLGLQFVSNLQGMTLISNTLDDPGIIDQMVVRTREWILSL